MNVNIGRNVYPRALLTSYNIPVIWCQNLETLERKLPLPPDPTVGSGGSGLKWEWVGGSVWEHKMVMPVRNNLSKILPT